MKRTMICVASAMLVAFAAGGLICGYAVYVHYDKETHRRPAPAPVVRQAPVWYPPIEFAEDDSGIEERLDRIEHELMTARFERERAEWEREREDGEW